MIWRGLIINVAQWLFGAGTLRAIIAATSVIALVTWAATKFQWWVD